MISKDQALKILEDVSAYDVVKLAWDVLPEHGSGKAYVVLDLEEGSVKSYYIPAGEFDEKVPHEIVLYELRNSKAYVIEEVFWGVDNEEDILDELAENCSTSIDFNRLVEQYYQAE